MNKITECCMRGWSLEKCYRFSRRFLSCVRSGSAIQLLYWCISEISLIPNPCPLTVQGSGFETTPAWEHARNQPIKAQQPQLLACATYTYENLKAFDANPITCYINSFWPNPVTCTCDQEHKVLHNDIIFIPPQYTMTSLCTVDVICSRMYRL